MRQYVRDDESVTALALLRGKMAFFRQTDEGIDDMVSTADLVRAMVLRLSESAAWEKHMGRHKDARLVKLDSNGEVASENPSINKKRGEDPQIFNYDNTNHRFTASCNCGQRFELDIKNDTVSTIDTGVKLRDLSEYNRVSGDAQGQDAGTNPAYQRGPVRQSAGYTSQKAVGYKN